MPKIALLGNPNVGKSVIFNALTGLNQTIANFPGCTVEKKEGGMVYENQAIEVIDLPGIYSLSPHSIDEQVSREYIIEENPDLVVMVLDASNLERINRWNSAVKMLVSVGNNYTLKKLDYQSHVLNPNRLN